MLDFEAELAFWCQVYTVHQNTSGSVTKPRDRKEAADAAVQHLREFVAAQMKERYGDTKDREIL